jgi:hypothetical protein
MNNHPLLIRKSILEVVCLTALGVLTAPAALIIGSLNTTYSEDFNTLASSGTSSTVPSGWAFVESGNGSKADGVYSAGTGSNDDGDTYSFGASNSSERALGQLRSGSVSTVIGVELENRTGTTITALLLSYVGEQWRLGATGRQDGMDFQYSLNATSLSTGTWTDFDALDFVAPTTSGAVGALDGNAAANRTWISSSLSGIAFASGTRMWLRWIDRDASSSDDGLAIDDFSLTAIPEPAIWGLLSSVGLAAIFGRSAWRERRAREAAASRAHPESPPA